MENQETLLSISEKRAILARMVRGQWKPTRYIKVKDQLVAVQDELSAQMLLRILALDTRLAAQMKKEQQQQEKANSKATKTPVAEPTPAAAAEETPTPAPASPQATTPAQKKSQPAKQVPFKTLLRERNRKRTAAKKAAKAST